eukprot:9478385-Pyramimonas_sp.AAC.1
MRAPLEQLRLRSRRALRGQRASASSEAVEPLVSRSATGEFDSPEIFADSFDGAWTLSPC